MPQARFRRLILVPAILAALLGVAPAAADVVVVVVSAQSTVRTLDPAALADIFLGKLGALPDGTRLVPVDLDQPTLHDTFYTKIIGKSPTQLRAYWSRLIFSGQGKPPRRASTAGELKSLLAQGAQYIGYLERGDLDATVREVAIASHPH